MMLDKVFNSFDFMCHTGFSSEGCAFHSTAKWAIVLLSKMQKCLSWKT
jgi:hypothetical protein